MIKKNKEYKKEERECDTLGFSFERKIIFAPWNHYHQKRHYMIIRKRC